MRHTAAVLARVLAPISRLALWISGLGLLVMTVFVAWQIFGRYVLNSSPSWTEPAALLLMSWFILLGSAVGVRDGTHMGFEIGLHYAPPVLKIVLIQTTNLLIVFFGLFMAWYGYELTVETWAAKMPGINLPQGVDYMPLAGGGLLIALFSFEKLVRVIADPDAAIKAVEAPKVEI
ncbi:TRAP transporter small permease [Phreatobacter stygius]|uniref:TRAP transporter small permease protein n=1 Tax=Phreatobacter stygius TaxID=1940610 RepID=A0A4D7AXI8_9HYPH|nr:TRAP transporter small permease [Phreatobacter stygius]QCI64195.1 TRAP transporter small permease [Phreatobacter stygius]